MSELKKNVDKFNEDSKTNKGYKYTTNNSFSSIVANKRITDKVNSMITNDINTLIDCGCGDGTYTNEIKKINPTLAIQAFDPASAAIEIAKKQYSNIEFFVASIYNVKEFNKRNNDLAVLRGILHHIPDQLQAIKNINQVSNKMLIIEPNGNNPILKLIEKKSTYHIEHEEQSFSSNQLKKWCLEAGWKINSIEYIGFVPFFFPTVLAKIIYFFQPLLEKIPIIKKYFSAQIIINCIKK